MKLSFRKLFKVAKIGFKIAAHFTPDDSIIDKIDNAISKVEIRKSNDIELAKAKQLLTKTAVDYALENMDVLEWGKKELDTDNIDMIKGYLYPMVKARYDKNKKKFRKGL